MAAVDGVLPRIRPYCYIPGKRKAIRFGYEKGFTKPATSVEWLGIYMRYKYYVYNIKRISLTWPQAGAPGIRGTRHFHYFYVPPMRFWNPEVLIYEKKVFKGAPSIEVEHVNGTIQEFITRNLDQDDIFKLITDFSEGKITTQTTPEITNQ
eukprot:TRINITY_DN7069_c0_g1_i1.p1 TRINITY_DN7069_c0_g1~~TRINITY_DN7069_c0_g1_i1.p1  ORF type:complete len:151 (-),score=17.10 TRINITY_DN7069_c0_g1_i1:11-463(-)